MYRLEDCNIIGEEIFFGRIKEDQLEDGSIEYNFEVLEGKVKNVICFDVFSPLEIIIDNKEYFIPSAMDDYYLLADEEEKGYYLCDMSRDNLLNRLCKRYNALLLSKETLHWMMDYDLDYIPGDQELVPNIYTLKDGIYVMTDDDLSDKIDASDEEQ